jgi:hypothetical protein
MMLVTYHVYITGLSSSYASWLMRDGFLLA